MSTTGSGDSQNVKVVVRVRPFNDREKQLNSPCIVQMHGDTTTLVNQEKVHEEPRKFTFDKSYWSHDGYKTTESGYCEPATSHYADQLKVYDEIGAPMLEAAWEGYNCSLFAYGQTGSGKSYTVMGYNANPGLVPNICNNLFKQIGSRRQPGVEYKVTFSMLEIYNEEVRDLLPAQAKIKSIGGKKPALNIREGKDKGFYADGLTVRPVSDYQAIKASLAEGDKNRTLAATKMNETSSRAHTIVTINFHQTKPNNITVLSAINLVDLAGSERQSQTKASGERFEESKMINQSLSTLGNVLKALVDKQKRKDVAVPYRNSKLTRLLKNALEGNSKTTMVATISPAADNYEQTLNTLKYADRAKAIRTHAVVNEKATDKLIKELLSEKEKLLLELERYKKKAVIGMSEEEVDELKANYENEIERYKQEMEDLSKSWEQRLKEEREASKQRISQLEEEEQQKKTMPYLWNLNEDPSLCNKISHFIEGSKTVGNLKTNPPADILLSGPSIHTQHAVVKLSEGRISIIPKHGKVYVNGDEVTGKKRLHHNDRICFGSSAIFVVCDPKKSKGDKSDNITYEFAQKELARHLVPEIEEEDELLKQEVLSVMPEVRDANAISEEFGKQCVFDIVLVSALARGKMDGRTEAFIKMTNHTNGAKYMWEKDKFLRRQAAMMKLYQDFEERGHAALSSISEYEDPFCEPYETDCLVGLVAVPLLSLGYLVTFNGTFPLLNYEAEQVGHVSVTLVPCDAQGTEKESHLEDEIDLVGMSVHFKIIIEEALSIPNMFKETWCSYRFYNSKPSVSPTEVGSNPKYAFEQMFSYKSVDHDLKLYLSQENLMIEVWGHQDISGSNDSSSSYRLHGKREEVARLKAELGSYRDCLMKISKIISSRKYCDECEDTFEEVEKELDVVLGI